MFRLFALSAVCLLMLTGNARAQVQSYEIDDEHLSVGFLVDHIGYAKVLGMFRKAEGTFDLDESTGVLSNIRIVIDTDSVYTNHKKRDKHLRSNDFLNVSEFPQMTYVAATAKSVGQRRYQIDGQLNLLGVSQPVTLEATLNKSADYPIGGLSKPYVVGVSVRGRFDRGDFGMSYALDNGWVGNEVALIIEFEARQI